MSRAALLVLLSGLLGCQTNKAPEKPIVVEVYADLVCPWCFIGTERLEKVLAESPNGARVQVKHRAFQLDPSTPPEGTDVAAMLEQRYGRPARELFAPAEAQARSSGLALDLSKQPRSYNTAAAHALLAKAEAKGTQRELKRALFRAHFVEAKNVSDVAVLTELATKHGFSADEVAQAVRDTSAVAVANDEARARGVTGVPYFVFCGGKAVSGAQPESVLRDAIAECAR